MVEHFLCSSCSHTWDAFQLAHASFRLYCVRNNYVLPDNGQKVSSNHGPQLLGDSPKINIVLPDRAAEEGEETSSDTLPVTKIYDGDVDVRLLMCGLPCTLVSGALLFLEDACLVGSLEDGINALLNIEVTNVILLLPQIRGSKLNNRIRGNEHFYLDHGNEIFKQLLVISNIFSSYLNDMTLLQLMDCDKMPDSVTPPLQDGPLSDAVVTMRCDLTTCSSTRTSILVSDSVQSCLNDQVKP
ncbi:hypothetical protein BHM03_00030588 [Ensete ventricosum]|nr:hypothetical protein BHM03_00030588 [Ensete ventricosum]